ncbi:MAG: transglutaminase-like domain-containing protein, partial [Myxococcota bacterium]
DPLTEFVLDHRAGHCEHFATAFATMLRAVGVPSRVVGGFQGGVWDESSDTVVFGLNNAHAWVEWYQPGRGWVLDDATPPFQGDRLSLFAIVIEQAQRAWDDYVLDYGLVEQFQLARQVSRRFTDFNVGAGSGSKKIQRIVGLVVASIFVGLGFWLWRRRRIAPSQDALAIAIERALSHVRGEPVTPAETFTEVLNLIESVPEWQSHLLHQAVDHYEHRRFGGRRYDVNREIELIRSLESVHKHNAARAA